MLKELQLENFRCFDNHIIPLRPTTIVVGRNNAGKSTIVEALRLISIVVNRYKHLNFSNVPDWLDIPRSFRGVVPSLKGMEFNFASIFYRYGDPPAIITATFDTKHTITVYIGPEGKIHSVIKNPDGTTITTKGQAKNTHFPSVKILPQIGPLARNERVLTYDYVRSAMSSYLAPLHFRNHLNLFYNESFEDFKQLSESTWPHLRILELGGGGLMPEDDYLSLLVQDGDFVAEISWMGHGLQMWLQTMWFLARTKDDNTIILDEPDVYMHADLQRKLIRHLKGRNQQIIIATHSVEIMAEVEADQVLVVDRMKKHSKFTTSLPAVQQVIDHIGGVHNLQLARLWTSRRCLLVEGKDIKYLKEFQNILFPDSQEPIDTIPNMSIGGWGGWNYAIGSSIFLKNAGGEDIIPYCILDSDYHTPSKIEGRLEEAKRRGVQLHIWSHKEIENYVIVPSAIHRVILSKISKRTTPPKIDEINAQIDQIVESFKDNVFDALASEYYAENKSGGPSTANRMAREQIDSKWNTLEGRLSIVSGKDVLSKLSKWSQEEFGVSFSHISITKELRPEEVADEMRLVVEDIENSQMFNT